METEVESRIERKEKKFNWDERGALLFYWIFLFSPSPLCHCGNRKIESCVYIYSPTSSPLLLTVYNPQSLISTMHIIYSNNRIKCEREQSTDYKNWNSNNIVGARGLYLRYKIYLCKEESLEDVVLLLHGGDLGEFISRSTAFSISNSI